MSLELKSDLILKSLEKGFYGHLKSRNLGQLAFLLITVSGLICVDQFHFMTSSNYFPTHFPFGKNRGVAFLLAFNKYCNTPLFSTLFH